MVVLINIIIVLLLVFMNAFFVATEFAVVKVRKSRIETLLLEGNKSAVHVLKVVKDLNAYLSACQLGITLASLGLGWVGEPAVSHMLTPVFKLFDIPESAVHSIAFVVGFAIITTFHIVLGELVPKSLAIISAEKISLYTAFPLIIFYKLTYPVMWAFNHSTELILRIFGLSQRDEHDTAYTDEEIKLLVEESYKHGLINQNELDFVDNVFNFSERTVKEIMVPRTDMKCIYIEDSFDEIIETTLNEQFTRYPVCREDKDNIIGFIHTKDLYRQKIQGNNANIEGIIREIKFVEESMLISELFNLFKKEKPQMAIIIDEYGGTFGLVTIEDILEELVGDIQDEFDEEDQEITKTQEGDYIVEGVVLLDDINELLEINIEEENIDTIGGWVYSQVNDYPEVNDKFTYGEYEFIVLECDSKRVSKVLIKKVSND
ncbi:hemolysin family protein [Clostridium cylindrosporum]|uniref:Uncharacterized protein n=1 Tax=Clostridium cylindrosporum DSM 605 TaxID=1121307 RepID=A0A0J8DDG5_CLOCY|nr:hemolysin family protein [Clostridium cylindrosporum]KMT22273.1 hypothetical protein CLCY_4c02460 [Clostridium cylindrosporum DSM 605]